MSRVLRVATRGGDLAVQQTQMVVDALRRSHSGLSVEVIEITTSGDRDRRTALWNLKSTGFFTTQVEDALLSGEADVAVHSLKDLPTAPRQGLTVAAVFDRRHVEDCLVAKDRPSSIEDLPCNARIGTSSLRRSVQLRRLRPDLHVTPIRGNVRTRMDMVEAGKVDAVVLARAGIERLDLQAKISMSFDPEQFIPAAAQGALAIQTRDDDEQSRQWVAAIDDTHGRTTAMAERQVLTTMRCGCHAPVGVHAVLDDEKLHMLAFVADTAAERFITLEQEGSADRSKDVARELAEALLAAGGAEILEELENERRGSQS